MKRGKINDITDTDKKLNILTLFLYLFIKLKKDIKNQKHKKITINTSVAKII